MNDIQRQRALEAEYQQVVAPHRIRLRELYRLMAIEEEHIEKKGRAVMMKSETITFTDPHP